MSDIVCFECNRGPLDGVPVFRQNAKGQPGIWACSEHNTARVDPEVAKIVGIIQGAEHGE